jgi:hypothetical protein
VAGRLAADAELDQDEGGAFERAVEVVRDAELTRVAGCVEHPCRKTANDLSPLGVDVLEHELVEVEVLALPCQAGDQLGRIRGAAPDDCELHAWHPVLVVAILLGT